MDLRKTIEDEDDVTDYSEGSEDETKDVQPMKKAKKTAEKGINPAKDFDGDFQFFSGTNGNISDYLLDSWSHISQYIKKKNSARTSVDVRIKKIRDEKRSKQNDNAKNEESDGSSDELSDDELVHDNINIKKTTKSRKYEEENGDEKVNPEVHVEEGKGVDDDQFFDLFAC